MNVRTSKLGLGTVQWGIPYGISHRGGVASVEDVGDMLSFARVARVTVLDTAAQYGRAEEALGTNDLNGFRVVTKTPRFDAQMSTAERVELMESSIHRSLSKLRLTTVYGLLMHDANDLMNPGGGALVEGMLALKAKGLVSRVGVSVYDARQIEAVTRLFTPDLIQLPINVLDQRLIEDGTLSSLRALGVEVHARSIFLQGLLLLPLDELPAGLEPLRVALERWHGACAEQHLSPTQAAMAFVRDRPEIDTCLVGVQNLQQLRTCTNDFAAECEFDATGLASTSHDLLNPSHWVAR